MSHSLYQEEEDASKAQETLIKGVGNDLMHSNLTLVYCAFPGRLPITGLPPTNPSHPQHLLVLAGDGI